MAFNQDNAAAGANGQDEKWKSDAFLNVWLTMPDGSKRKLGFIGLKKSKNFEKALIERLSTGGEEAMEGFVGKVTMDFQLANTAAVNPDELGF